MPTYRGPDGTELAYDLLGDQHSRTGRGSRSAGTAFTQPTAVRFRTVVGGFLTSIGG